MLAFVLRRLIQAVVVMLTVAFIAFMLFQYVGDPVTNLLGQDATAEQREQLRADLGLDAPFPVQFVRFVGNAVRGEFGLSLRQGRRVSALIVERFPATIELATSAAVIALLLGVPLGVYTALRRGTFASQLWMTLSLVGVSLPTFLIGILLILLFAVIFKVLPSFGRGDVVSIGGWTTGLLTLDGWKHLVLPAVTLSVFQLALILRLVRAEMLEVLRTDYIKFARARGLERSRRVLRTCAEEHAGAGDHDHRPAVGWLDRVCDHHRDGVPVARHGAVVHPGRAVRRRPGDGGLPVPDRVDLRVDQPGRSTCCISLSTRACASSALPRPTE